MYKEHQTLIQPENESIRIWRYMDFTKMVSLIDSRKLYFTRVDKFDDPFEGSLPKANVAARKDFILTNFPPKVSQKFLNEIHEKMPHWSRYVAINCWHMNEHESAAMWNLYLKSNEGIAIQSKYAKLKKSLIDDEEIFLGKVKYINYDTEFIDGKYYILSPFFYKRKSFEHEQEVRAIVTKWPIDGNNIDFTQETIRHGMEIKVDIETLIERIYVAPSAPDWFADIVKAVVTKYGYNFNIVHSKLNENPVF